MSQSELLREVVGILDQLSIPYMLTGSYASSYQGYPRSSHDIDLIIDVVPAGIDELISRFQAPRFYASAPAITEAVRRRSMFTISEIDTGDKIDFWILKRTAFDQSRFARRVSEKDGQAVLWLTAPEDTILQKLRWAKDSGGSEKQWKDARSVFLVQKTRLDIEYLRRWATELDVSDSLEGLMRDDNSTQTQ